jgi:transcriptional regulator with XRE-family HTH domain
VFVFPPPPVPFSLPLPHERLNWLLEVLGWTQPELAKRLDLSSSKVNTWIKGRSKPPNIVAIWLEMLAQTMMANAKPLLWVHDPTVTREVHEARRKQLEEAYERFEAEE